MLHTHRIRATLLALMVVLMLGATPEQPAFSAEPLSLQSTVTLTAAADVTLKSWQPNANFGSEQTLQAAHSEIDGSQSAVMLVRFDLSALPGNAVIDSADLELYLESSRGLDPVYLGIYYVNDAWAESDVTWNTAPPVATTGLTWQVDSSLGYKSHGGLGGWVSTWMAGANNGVMIYGSLSGDFYQRIFQSRESGQNMPRLVVTYHIEAPTLSGHVYIGEIGATDYPLEGVAVALYGANDPYPALGALIAEDTTDAAGLYDLPVPYGYEYYAIHQTDLPDYLSVGATTVDGIVRTANWIEYVIPFDGKIWSDNNFWDALPAVDLIISDIWREGNAICYQIVNTGNITATAGHVTALWVDGNRVDSHPVDVDLDTGGHTTACFAYLWTCSLPDDTIAVEADETNSIAESDEANNIREETWLCDVIPPEITAGPTVTAVTQNSALISWQTNEESDSAVRYDRRAGYYALEVSDAALVVDHNLTLSGLTPATTYHFIARSSDMGGNVVESRDITFETLPPVDDEDPTVTLDAPIVGRGVVTVTAEATDNVGVAKVEFYLDGALLWTDYTSPYILILDTLRYLNGDYQITAKAYDRSGRSVIADRGFNIFNLVDVTAPTAAITYPGEWATISGTLSVLVTLHDDVGVFQAYLYVDGVAVGHKLFPANTTDTTAQFDWDSTTVSNDNHRLGVRVYDADFKTGLDTVDVIISNPALPPQPNLVVTAHTITRYQNSFNVAVTVKNVGQGTASHITLVDRARLFQPISRIDFVNGPAEYTAQFDISTMTGECHIDSLLDIAPGESRIYLYGLVPVLTHPASLTPALGESLHVYYKAVDGVPYSAEINVPVLYTTGNEPLVTAHKNALAAADYLIVTNPRRLFWNELPYSFFGANIFPLFSEMAQLAAFNDGVLGYIDMNDREALRTLIRPTGAWAKQLHANFRAAGKGYLLIVGEMEIIPTWLIAGWNLTWSNWNCTTNQVDLTDLPYADTGGDGAPELIVGRIIGNSAADLRHALETSNRVYANYPGYNFDRSDALLVSGLDGNANIQKSFTQFVIDTAQILQGEFTVDPMHWSAIAATQRVAEFRNRAVDKDVIVYQGHGGPDSWGPLGTTDVTGNPLAMPPVPPVSFGNTHPFIFGLACLTGSYEDHTANAPCGAFDGGDDNLAEAFFDRGAGVYIGSTEVSPISTNVEAGKAFFQKWWKPYTSLGKALADLKRDRWSQSHLWRFWVTEYNLYGDPKYGVAPPGDLQTTALTAAAALTGPLSAIDVEVPAYTVTSDDGWDYVEIPGGDILLEPGGYRVPYYVVTIDYPAGHKIQDVTLLSRSTPITDSGLHIPTVTNELAFVAGTGATHLAQNGEWVPAPGNYSWTVRTDADGGSALVLILYAFEYNPATSEVRFYQNYSLAISYTISPVALTSLTTGASQYAQGEPVTVQLLLENEAGPQDVVVRTVIREAGSGEIVAGLPMETLADLAGEAAFAPHWNSEGAAPGYYYVETIVQDATGALLDQGTAPFRLGIVSGEVVGFSVTPEIFVVGETIALSLVFSNTGTLDIVGTAVFRVQDRLGNIVREFHQPVALSPHASIRFDEVWDTTGIAEGTYGISGSVLYDNMMSDPCSIMVQTTVAARIYLPLVIKNNPFENRASSGAKESAHRVNDGIPVYHPGFR